MSAPLPAFVEAARATFRAAMIARDAIESCCSPEWRAAHAVANEAARAMDDAYARAYAAKLLVKPYWA